jgi:hypothetical protein
MHMPKARLSRNGERPVVPSLLFLLLLGLPLFAPLTALTSLAQTEEAPIVHYVPEGAVTPNWSLPLRASPPGFFKGKGEVIAEVTSGMVYLPLENKTVWGLTGSQNWVKLKNLQDGTEGWVYGGKNPSDLSNLFQAYEPTNPPSM